MEYTKGPWEVVTKGNTVKSLAIEGVCHGMKLNSNDARLISAAPMMYEALKAIQECKGNPKMLEGIIIMQRVEQALAKAEGK